MQNIIGTIRPWGWGSRSFENLENEVFLLNFICFNNTNCCQKTSFK